MTSVFRCNFHIVLFFVAAFFMAGLTSGCVIENDFSQVKRPTFKTPEETAEETEEDREFVHVDGEQSEWLEEDRELSPYVFDRILSASLDGDFGSVKGVSQGADRVTAYEEGEMTIIEAAATTNTGVAMISLTMDKNVDELRKLVQGRAWQITDNDVFDYLEGGESSSPLFLMVIGCSGESDYNWQWDEQAKTTEFSFEVSPESPDVLLFHFVAQFSEGEEVTNQGNLILAAASEIRGTIEFQIKPVEAFADEDVVE